MKWCKIVILILLLMVLFSLSLLAQAPDTLWTKTYGGPDKDEGYCVCQTSDGGYVIVGQTKSFGSGLTDVYLIKTDSTGDTLWTKTFGGTDFDVGSSIKQSSDGGYIIAGDSWSYGTASDDAYFIKTNFNGDTLWTKTYGGINYDYCYEIQEAIYGGFIATGWTDSYGAGNYDVYLIKITASGDSAWAKTFGGIENDGGFSVKQTFDGGFIVAGCTESFGAGNNDVYLIKTTADGNAYWIKNYGGFDTDIGFSVLQTPDAGYIIAGSTTSYGAGGCDVYLVRTDMNGDTLWTRNYGGTSYDVARAIQRTSDGGYIIAGSTESFGAGNSDIYLIKTDETGNLQWSKTIGGAEDDIGFSVQQTTDSGYIVVGTKFQYGAEDVFLIKINSDAGIKQREGCKVIPSYTKIRVFPNPFTHTINIRNCSGGVIYDVSGKFVTEIKDRWDGKNSSGEEVKPGIYFLKVDAKYFEKVVKIR